MGIYKIYVLDPSEWDLKFDAIPWNQRPRKIYTPKAWSEKNGNPDLTLNATYFNFDCAASRKSDSVYACVQELRIQRYASYCGYGGQGETLTLPNGDFVKGFTTGIKDDVVVSKSTSGASCRNGLGMTTDGKYIVAQCSTNVSFKTFSVNVLSKVKAMGYSVKLFIEMDGGGSVGTYSAKSKMLFAPKKEGANGRAVASVLCITYKGGRKITVTLKKGSRSDDVKLLQTILGTVEVDGLYGNGTASAVKQTQKNLGLFADGIAGPVTLKALGLK